MTKLRAPLSPLLDEPLSELELQRMWRKLQHGQQIRPEPRRLRWPLMAAVAAGTLSVLLWLAPWPRNATRPLPLALQDHLALTPQSSWGGRQEQRMDLNDGSQIRIASGARLEVLDNRGPVFTTRLRQGHADFVVNPGGPRRWRVECDSLSVEVIGTQFSVEHTDHGVRVNVVHGVVAVRGRNVPGGARRLTAGDELYVEREALPVVGTTLPSRPLAPAPTAPILALPPSAAESRATPAESRAAPPAATIAPAPVRAEKQPVNELSRMLRRADAARRVGDLAHARAILQQVIRVAPRGQYAVIAGLTLGRMLMLDQPARAAEALRTALTAAPPSDLREDIMARLVEASARAGQTARARELAAAYERAFPDGLHRTEVARWVQQP